VRPDCMPKLMEYAPEIVVVGGYVGSARDPVSAVSAIRDHFLSQSEADAKRAKIRSEIVEPVAGGDGGAAAAAEPVIGTQPSVALIASSSSSSRGPETADAAAAAGAATAAAPSTGGGGDSQSSHGGGGVAHALSTVILPELTQSAALVCQAPVAMASDALASQLLKADRVFVAGMGRSGFVMRGLAMRLRHLGLDAHVVGGQAVFILESVHID
jgi:hypothetical protein